jgi:hypothetical protein
VFWGDLREVLEASSLDDSRNFFQSCSASSLVLPTPPATNRTPLFSSNLASFSSMRDQSLIVRNSPIESKPNL